MTETLSSDWFKQLDDLDRLRVLYYYRVTRPHDEETEYDQRTGSAPTRDLVKPEDEFAEALRTSKEAEAIWTRATADSHIDPPL